MEAIRPLLKLIAESPNATPILLILTIMMVVIGLAGVIIKYMEHRAQLARLEHEKEGWKYQLTLLTQEKMLDRRIEVYPGIIKTIKPLSGYNQKQITGSKLRALADKLQKYIYGKAAALMEADTRKALVILRNECRRLGEEYRKDEIKNKTERIGLLLKYRTDALELLRRDLNLESMWRPGQRNYLSTSEGKLKHRGDPNGPGSRKSMQSR